jgi:molecular chaperone DnaK
MSAVVGIDLGTTNTVVAHVDGGKAIALADETGERLIPSVVSFHPSGQVIVGKTAKERRLIDARNTVYSVKRLIGRAWASEDVRRAKERAPFELREGPGHAVLVVARGETYTLSEISAYVLRKAKAVAEAALGQPVDRAVITVPANFNDLQRAATKVAGRVAGLEVLRILNEPTAAALAYGYGKSNAERVAIYDFGGGTFDVTLLDLSGNVFEVLATAGDTFLGGDDIDLLIADRICEAFLKEHRYDPRTDVQVFEKVRAAAETLKHQLSRDSQVGVELREIAYGPGGKSLGLNFSMTRVELDKLIGPLIERTFAVCRDAIATARMSTREFDQIILVGGSTRIPQVRARVAEFFGKDPLAHVSPDEVVAIGAAIQAMALTSDRRTTRDSSVSISTTPTSGEKKPQTLGGLGDAAAQARSRVKTDNPLDGQPSTTKGLGARTRTLLGTTGPIVVPPATAMTERAPATADFADEKTVVVQGFSPDLTPHPAPAPARPPAAPLGGPTKMSLGADAQAAQARAGRQRTPTTPPAQIEALRTEDSVMASLPLVGAGLRRLANLSPAVHERPTAPPTGDRPTTPAPEGMDLAAWGLDDPAEPEIPLELDTAPRPPAKGVGATQVMQAQAPPPSVPDLPAVLGKIPLMQQARPAAPPPVPATPPPQAAPPPVPAAPPGVGRTQQMQVPVAPMPPVVISDKAPEPARAPAAAPLIIADLFQPGPIAARAAPSPAVAPPAAPPVTAMAPVAPPIVVRPAPKVPLLVDVTPLSLSVETVGGYCDVIISRNTPIPCDGTRVFATVTNHQKMVKVRVAQGESSRFGENTLLGELELSDLRDSARGEVEISVTFEIDADGIMQVRARDLGTGREALARMRMIGAQDAAATQQARSRQDRQVVV